jgi:hypothetical protein
MSTERPNSRADKKTRRYVDPLDSLTPGAACRLTGGPTMQWLNRLVLHLRAHGGGRHNLRGVIRHLGGLHDSFLLTIKLGAASQPSSLASSHRITPPPEKPRKVRVPPRQESVPVAVEVSVRGCVASLRHQEDDPDKVWLYCSAGCRQFLAVVGLRRGSAARRRLAASRPKS